jgi:deazaflavin-dependent oxidoreductase (nitroreductase family)
MEAQVRDALRNDRIIDITTTGRKSGNPVRKEMWFHNVDDVIYITGTPGRRDWYANMVANPQFGFHLKQSASADLQARAHPITDREEKRAVLETILARLEREDQIGQWVADSPLVRVEFSQN